MEIRYVIYCGEIEWTSFTWQGDAEAYLQGAIASDPTQEWHLVEERRAIKSPGS